MADEATPTPPPAPTLASILGTPIIRSADHRTVYANNCQVRISPWDIALSFSRVIELHPGVLGQEQLVDVIMAPAQAKAFLVAMTETLKAFEEVFGELKLNPVLAPDTDSIRAIVSGVMERMKAQKQQLHEFNVARAKAGTP